MFDTRTFRRNRLDLVWGVRREGGQLYCKIYDWCVNTRKVHAVSTIEIGTHANSEVVGIHMLCASTRCERDCSVMDHSDVSHGYARKHWVSVKVESRIVVNKSSIPTLGMMFPRNIVSMGPTIVGIVVAFSGGGMLSGVEGACVGALAGC